MSVENQVREGLLLPRAFLRACRSVGGRLKMADSTGMKLTGHETLLRTLILRRLLRRTLRADEQFVGVLIPPSVGGVLVNAALAIDRRVSVNLNFTLKAETLNYCLKLCNIRHVITSRKVMERMSLQLDAELVYLEDFKDKVTWADKLVSAAQARLAPLGMLERQLGIDSLRDDDLLTVLFTSGSTGVPKGVMLSQRNVASNVYAMDGVVSLAARDILMGALPFFHSYGYTATLWTCLALEPTGIYHFSPLEAQVIGQLCGKYKATILLTTPTFLRNYLKRCKPEDFQTLEFVAGSAEKLPVELSEAFEKRFGVRPVEAYGATEMSPLIAVNVPPKRRRDQGQHGAKEGTVGQAIPGTTARIVDPETGRELPVGQSGMLQVTGPNVMLGYYQQPELTAKAVRDGWYETGDLASLDEEGFIKITGRQSRFSKIGGEMVPHILVEEQIRKVIGADEDQIVAAVTAVPDAARGERLVVLHTALTKTPQQIGRELAEAGLPNLWIPSPDSFLEVTEIPVLGTGKLDLKGVQNVALERIGAPLVGSR